MEKTKIVNVSSKSQKKNSKINLGQANRDNRSEKYKENIQQKGPPKPEIESLKKL